MFPYDRPDRLANYVLPSLSGAPHVLVCLQTSPLHPPLSLSLSLSLSFFFFCWCLIVQGLNILPPLNGALHVVVCLQTSPQASAAGLQRVASSGQLGGQRERVPSPGNPLHGHETVRGGDNHQANLPAQTIDGVTLSSVTPRGVTPSSVTPWKYVFDVTSVGQRSSP